MMTKVDIIRNNRIPEGHDHYSYGFCPSCHRWQQLIDWNATHRLTCPAKAQKRPLLIAKPKVKA